MSAAADWSVIWNFAWNSDTSFEYNRRVGSLTLRRRSTPEGDSIPNRIGAVLVTARAARSPSALLRPLTLGDGTRGTGCVRQRLSLGNQTDARESGRTAFARPVADGELDGIVPLGIWERAHGDSVEGSGVTGGVRRVDGAKPVWVERRLAHTAEPTARSGPKQSPRDDRAELMSVASCERRLPVPSPIGELDLAAENLVRNDAFALLANDLECEEVRSESGWFPVCRAERASVVEDVNAVGGGEGAAERPILPETGAAGIFDNDVDAALGGNADELDQEREEAPTVALLLLAADDMTRRNRVGGARNGEPQAPHEAAMHTGEHAALDGGS